MAKYYVQSGQLKMVMDASDPSGAALWAIHSKLGEIAFIYEGDEYTEQQQIDQVLMHALIELETSILVSERGFGRADSRYFDTFDIAMQWHQLAKALTKIEEK